MGKNVAPNGMKEGMNMASEQRGQTANTRQRLHALIESGDSSVLNACLKDWGARRCTMRETLPGDYRRR